jgi:protoporphyrinogen oxidase
MPETLIIGAGPTGMGAALRLEQLGRHDWALLEKENIPGGLCSSILDPLGFTWDLGIHATCSHYQYFSQFLNDVVEDWICHKRETWIQLGNRWIPYPFQNNIHHLAKDDQKRCLQGLISRKHVTPTHFRDWIDNSFGRGIADIFMIPYNDKIWAYPPEELSYEWVGERVATVDLSGIFDSILDKSDASSWGPNFRFLFPRSGGTGRIWQEAAARLPQDHLHFQQEALKIDTKNRIVYTASGKFEYENLVSTMPLDLLLSRLDIELDLENVVPPKYSSVHVIGVGLSGEPPERIRGKSWIYFPDPQIPFYRATLLSSFAPGNAPEGYWSLLFEASESRQRQLGGDLFQQTINAATQIGMIPPGRAIASQFHRRLEHGYPTPYLGRNKYLEKAQPQLAALGILSRGRFGGWKYEVANQDHSMMQGVEAVDRLVYGAEEFTYFYPQEANNRKETSRSFTPVTRASSKARLFENIRTDLGPWQDGITREQFEKTRNTSWRGLHIKIIDGQPQVYKEVPSFQTRNHCILLMLREAAARFSLPDCEFVIHTDDIPPTADLPMFTFCKRKGERTILFPDFSFYCWLEAFLPSVDSAKEYIGRGQCPWNEKIDRVFFAGAATSPIRIQLGHMNHEFLDIRITDWTKNRTQFVPPDEHNRWKYLLNLSERSWSVRLKYLFFTNSLVIQGDNEWLEFWSPILDYGKDCLNHDLSDAASVDRLHTILSELSHEEAEQIARNGHEKVSQTLTLDNVYEYIAGLICEYATLCKFEVQQENYQLVIARYNEDISWSDGRPRIIYNKGEKIEGLPEKEQVFLPNVGREAHTYLTYVIDHYDNLPDYVMFCQGRIHDHIGSLDIDSYINPDYDFIASGMSNHIAWDPSTGRLNHIEPWLASLQQGKMRKAELGINEWFEQILRVPMQEHMLWVPAAIFCVSAKNIRRRHIKFYMKLRDFVSHHSEPEEAHYFERSWVYIFTDNNTRLLNLA